MKYNVCTMLLLTVVVMAVCVQDSEAGWFRLRRIRIRLRRAWDWAKEHVRIRVGVRATYSATECENSYVSNNSREKLVQSQDLGLINADIAKTRDVVFMVREAENEPCYDSITCSELQQQLQDQYHFIVGQDGQVYEGLGWDYKGTFGDQAIGIAVAGRYTKFPKRPDTKDSMDALRKVIQCGIQKNKLAPAPNFDLSPDLPNNDPMFVIIKSWNAKPVKG